MGVKAALPSLSLNKNALNQWKDERWGEKQGWAGARDEQRVGEEAGLAVG